MEFLIYIVGVLLMLVPMWKLTERAGYNPLWSLACLFPLGVIVLLWVLAFRPASGRS